MGDSASGDDATTLSELFDKSFELVNALEVSTHDTGSYEFQKDVKKGLSQLETATELVNQIALFSSNEQIEEVNSREVKFMLIPALLGYLTMKLTGTDRLEALTLARVYFRDFIKRLNSYGVVKVRLSGTEESEEEESEGASVALTSDPSLEAMASKRHQKLLRYKAIKEMETSLSEMGNVIATKGEKNIEDEYLRKYYITLLKKWVATSLDELDSIELEKKMLEQMSKSGRSFEEASHRAASKPKKPMRPFIITRDAIQKKVYGLGYPAIPTMSVDEFVDSKMADGTWAFNDKKVYNNSLQNWAEDPERKAESSEEEDEKNERLAEREDEDALKKARGWDDFKDENKRGAGNRKNMG